MSKHTPGPWAVEPRQWDHGASLAIVAPNNGYIVAIVPFDEDIQTVDEPDYETVKRHPDDVPNAHLIAAAPAMYEALKAIQEKISGADVLFDPNPQWEGDQARYDAAQEALFSVDQALAQAEGK